MHISQISLFPHEIQGKTNLEELINNLFKPDQAHFNIKENYMSKKPSYEELEQRIKDLDPLFHSDHKHARGGAHRK